MLQLASLEAKLETHNAAQNTIVGRNKSCDIGHRWASQNRRTDFVWSKTKQE
jgi:hypothetical protein